jgi:hypothetical protein
MKLIFCLSLLFTLTLAQFEEIGNAKLPLTCQEIENKYLEEVIKCGNNNICLEKIDDKKIKGCIDTSYYKDCNFNNRYMFCKKSYEGNSVFGLKFFCGLEECNKFIESSKSKGECQNINMDRYFYTTCK